MARSLRSLVKSWFQTGDVPTQAQYSDTIDSSVYWEDDIEHTLTNDANKVPASDAVFAAIGAVPTPNLNEVLVEGNETLGTNIKVNDADAIELENTSLLKKGTYDFGGDGGISRICSVGYEDMWQSGIRYVFDNLGYVREATNCFNIVPDGSFDDTLQFKVGSRWILDDGSVYICLNATPGSVDWDLIPSVPTLQEVTNAGATTTNSIDVLALNIKQVNEQLSFASNGQIDFTPDTTTPANKTTLLITAPTANNNITFKDESGTVAFLSDIPSGGVASVTGNIVDNTDPANPDASLTAANVHTFVDSLTALVTPADNDKMIIVDNSVSLAKKITWIHIKDTLKAYFDALLPILAETCTDGVLVGNGGVGTTTNTYTGGVLITPSIINADTTIEVLAGFRKSAANGAVTIRIYANTTNDISGSPILIGQALYAAGILYSAQSRQLRIKVKAGTGAGTEVLNTGINSVFSDLSNMTLAASNLAIDWTTNKYIVVSLQLGVATATTGDSARLTFLKVRR